MQMKKGMFFLVAMVFAGMAQAATSQGKSTVTVAINDTTMGEVFVANNMTRGYEMAPMSNVYNDGIVITVYAQPKEGCQFVKWTNGEKEDEFSFRVDGGFGIGAIFAKTPVVPTADASVAPANLAVAQSSAHSFMFHVNDASMGSVKVLDNYKTDWSRPDVGCAFLDRTVLQLTATPKEGFRFVQWSDGVTAANRKLALVRDTVVTAIFARIEPTISVLSTDAVEPAKALMIHHFTVHVNDTSLGSIKVYDAYRANWSTLNNTVVFVDNAKLELNAFPKPDCEFVMWSDGDTSASRVITLVQDTSITAIFAKSLPLVQRTVILPDPIIPVFKKMEDNAPKALKRAGEDLKSGKNVAVYFPFIATASGRNVHIAGGAVGVGYDVVDAHGRVVLNGRVEKADFDLTLSHAGSYMVRIGDQTQRVTLH